jgi:predicted dehydrogenase
MLKVAIIGCGKIADAHASQIQHIPGCELAAVCDSEELMAQQLFERFPVKKAFTNIETMLREAQPDVVHITTPPQSHLPLALHCLEAGCHVFVEKPFTVDTAEAETLLAAAQKTGRKVTVGHDAQFSDVNLRLRQLVRGGFAGDRVVHMESVWCYDLGDVTYAKSLLDNNRHWSRQLPGGLLQNIISHGIAKIAEFLGDDCPQVTARGFVSPFLRNVGETTLLDELRVILIDSAGTSAYFTFSSQRRPATNQFHLYGSRNGIMIDEDRRMLVKLDGGAYKSYANHFIPPLAAARHLAANSVRNMADFLNRKYHMDSGRRSLIQAFYQSIERDSPPPIPYAEILRVSRIMDEIFAQLNASREEGSAGCFEETRCAEQKAVA